jgi:hypothetical protein
MRASPTLSAIFLLVLLANPLTLAKSSLVITRPSSGSSDPRKSAIVSSDEVLVSLDRDETPTVAFCEMVKNPRLYFDKRVRVTATLQLATEASYLQDDKCVLSHDDQIGVRYVSENDKERDLLNSAIRKVRTVEYGGRAKVTVVGVLRNSSLRSFAWYRYRFDVSRLEGMTPLIVPYEGTLQAGTTYRADVRGDKDFGLSLVSPLHMVLHVGVRIEWTNLGEFPALAELQSDSPAQSIVFTVVADETKRMTERRWSRTVECKILSL